METKTMVQVAVAVLVAIILAGVIGTQITSVIGDGGGLSGTTFSAVQAILPLVPLGIVVGVLYLAYKMTNGNGNR